MTAPPSPPAPQLPPVSGWSDFFRGFALPFHAIRLMFGHRKVFLLSTLASVVTFFSLVALVWLLVSYTSSWVGLVWAQPTTWYGAGLWYLVVALTFLVLLMVGANTVPLLLLAPLQDPISEAAEAAYGDAPLGTPFSLLDFLRSVGASVAHALGLLAIMFAGHALLLPLNLIPGAGNIIWTVSATVWTMWWCAGEYLAGVMARHRYTLPDVVRALWHRRRLALGFGAAVYLMLWVPILNLFFIPLAVIAGTQLYRGLRGAGHIPPPPVRG